MRCALLLILALFLPAPISAQAPTIPPGTRVRVETQQRARVDGTLMSQSSDSIIVATPRPLRTAVASGDVTRIAVSKGRSHVQGALRGMKIGAAIVGGAATFMVGAAYFGGRTEESSIVPLYAFAVSGAAVGAMSGAAFGGMLGAEKWSTVYSAAMRVSVRPFQSRVPGVGVSIRF